MRSRANNHVQRTERLPVLARRHEQTCRKSGCCDLSSIGTPLAQALQMDLRSIVHALPMLLLPIAAGCQSETAAPAEQAEEQLVQFAANMPGARIIEGRAYGTDYAATIIDLCADQTRVVATEPGQNRRTTTSWAKSKGVQIAVNGDFFESNGAVYGAAVGGGLTWPDAQTGNHPGKSWAWYYGKPGWIAVGPGWVEYNHTGWVKQNLDVDGGWRPDAFTHELPPGTTALVSGFPELVTEGRRHDCSAGPNCFPDRPDMDARHPRTAMGLSADKTELILLVANGRKAGQAGLKGIDLAQLMYDLGSHQAFNLDGGGSSELYYDEALRMAPAGQRTVPNHLGVYTGNSSGMPLAPAHCAPPPGPCPDGRSCDTLATVSPEARFTVYKKVQKAASKESFYYGNPGDLPLMGDWNCDGVKTPAMYRAGNGFMYLRNTNTQGNADVSYFYGTPSDIPLAGDWDGNGCDSLAVYRPSEGQIYIKDSLGAGVADYSYFFGNPGDTPFVGDFDGDGIDTLGLYRENTGKVYIRNDHSTGPADYEFFYGDPGDQILAGDWDGDGTDTVAIYRPSAQTLFLRNSNSTGPADFILPSLGKVEHAVVARE